MNIGLLNQWRAQTAVPADRSAAGHAFVIQVEPDLAAGERINVGVAVVGADGRRLTKMVQDHGRIACFYGPEVAELVETLAEFGRAAALGNMTPPGPSVLFTAPQPFFGMTPQAYLDTLFDRMVPAGKPHRLRSERDKPRDTDALWREVGNIIKLRLPEQAEQILASTPVTLVTTPRSPLPVQVRIPLTPPGGAGALESADFSVDVTKRKLMAALLDVQIATEARQLRKQGLFIARPGRVRHPADLQHIENAIDFVVCRAPKNCRVAVETDAERLTDHILDWAEVNAA